MATNVIRDQIERARASLARFAGRPGLLALAVVVGLVTGLGLVVRDPFDETDPKMSLLGEPVPLDPTADAIVLERLRRHTSQSFTLRLSDGISDRAPTPGQRRVSFGELGVALDTLRAQQLARDARDATSPLRKLRRRLAPDQATPDQATELPPALVLLPDRASSFLIGLKHELDRKPVDAKLNLKLGTLESEKSGQLVDLDATLEAIAHAVARGETEARVILEILAPRRRAVNLAGIQYDHVLARFDTPYDRSSSARARTFNLELAASKLDGQVLMPGEELDFNRTVGPRDEASGYKVAPVIAQGELVDGIGGGTCQVSGTLHAAALFAGLEITERYPHTRPSSYIKMGLDATVVYPTINFRIKNPFAFPVVLHEVVSEGRVRAEILGPATQASTTMIRRVLDVIPYDEIERLDAALPRGARTLGQRGIPGFKVIRYRITREGRHALRERWTDTYPPTPQIIRIGTGEPKPGDTLPPDDPHSEYLADELLVLTQIRRAGEPVITAEREPGKFGRPGWTGEAGMVVWSHDRASQRPGSSVGNSAEAHRSGVFSPLRKGRTPTGNLLKLQQDSL